MIKTDNITMRKCQDTQVHKTLHEKKNRINFQQRPNSNHLRKIYKQMKLNTLREKRLSIAHIDSSFEPVINLIKIRIAFSSWA